MLELVDDFKMFMLIENVNLMFVVATIIYQKTSLTLTSPHSLPQNFALVKCVCN